MIFHVRVYDKSRQSIVNFFARFVTYDRQDIKTGQNGICQVDIVIEVFLRLVDSSDRIGGSYHRTARLQRSNYAGFRNRNRLLLHGFVDRGTIFVVHLVEFVNQTDTLVS